MTFSMMRHMPDDACEIIADQGWDNESMILHLYGWAQELSKDPGMSLATYLTMVAREENASLEPEEPCMVLCTFRPQRVMNDHIYPAEDGPTDQWLVTSAEFERLTGHSPQTVEECSYDTDRLTGAFQAPQSVRDWGGPYEVDFEILHGVKSLLEIRRAVIGDMQNSVRSDISFADDLIERHINRESDADVAQAYLDAELGESHD